MTQAQKLADLSQAFTAGALGFRNLLQNPLFRVNQRGYLSGTGWAANSCTLDRWKNVAAGQGIVFAANGNGYIVTAPSSGMEQVVEGVEIAGGTYCLYWEGTATATVNGSAISKGGNFTLPSNTTAAVRFAGGTVSKPQLEQGAIPTTFDCRPYQLDLLVCQRFLPGFVVQGSGTTCQIGNGYVNTATTAVIFVPFPTRTRIPPTAVTSFDASGNSSGTVGIVYSAAGTFATNGITFNPNTDVTSGCLVPSTANSMTSGHGCALGLSGLGVRLLFVGAEL